MNIFITSDHGFSTHTGATDLKSYLIRKKLKASNDSDDVVVVQGAIYVKNHDAEKIRQIVTELQKADWVGALFTAGRKPGGSQGMIPGTFSTELAHGTMKGPPISLSPAIGRATPINLVTAARQRSREQPATGRRARLISITLWWQPDRILSGALRWRIPPATSILHRRFVICWELKSIRRWMAVF